MKRRDKEHAAPYHAPNHGPRRDSPERRAIENIKHRPMLLCFPRRARKARRNLNPLSPPHSRLPAASALEAYMEPEFVPRPRARDKPKLAIASASDQIVAVDQHDLRSSVRG